METSLWAIRNHNFAETVAFMQNAERDCKRDFSTLVMTYLALLTNDFFYHGHHLRRECLIGGTERFVTVCLCGADSHPSH